MAVQFLIVGLGGAIGSMARYGCSALLPTKNFPITTLLINIIGSLLIGIIIGASIKYSTLSNYYKLFFATGICGGFTTFSTFSLENMQLLQQGKFVTCAMYIFLSIVLSIAFTMFGYKIFNL
jgi:fluoride exporter